MQLNFNMGQKLSDLKGLLVTRVEETGENEKGLKDMTSNDNFKSDKMRRVCNSNDSVSLNGDDVGNTKGHYESIYSNSFENVAEASEHIYSNPFENTSERREHIYCNPFENTSERRERIYCNSFENKAETSGHNYCNSFENSAETSEHIYCNSFENIARTSELNGNILPQHLPHNSQCDGRKQPCTCSVNIKAKLKECRKGSEGQHGKMLKRNSLRTMSFVGKRRSRSKTIRTKDSIGDNVKKRSTWVLKFNCAKLKPRFHGSSSSFVESDIPQPNIVCDSCVCTGYRRTEEHHLGAGVIFEADTSNGEHSNGAPRRKSCPALTAAKVEEPTRNNPVIDLSKFNPEDFPIEDCDERARLERAKEIAEGVEPPPGFQPGQHIQLVCPPDFTLDNVVSRHVTMLFQTHFGFQTAAALSAFSQVDVTLPPTVQRMVHTQVDYIHCLVPDLLQITLSSYYWGKMDRFEAERLLEGRPEGTFLLRDSSQEEYIFSVSFRRYGRSLHARVEQWNHMFSFDSHDPGVFSSPTVCGLLEHYKDPSCCMFFEPMLAIPFHRNFPFPLQHLCRATVCSRTKYDSINQLNLPRALKSYLKEYHYKQRVRVRRFDAEL